MLAFAEVPEAGSDKRFVESFFRMKPRRLDQVTGNVFGRKLIVRDIRVQGADDVVAIFVGVMQWVVEFVTVAFCVACEVQPVTSPAFAKVW